ncbi:MAG: metallophosphoesterase, partial [Thermoplasmata archaeon]|nr:metallophosphoesterase [Thermoplasmata archaeon]NIY05444.1 serine/threonine protein phosphatase [Thermoplasmata archaeon]
MHKELPETGREEQGRLLETLLRIYLDSAAELGLRLDEGLSNFGRNPEGEMFYLDDDTYEWDNFLSLAEALGYWVRLDLALEAEGFQSLGERLASIILRDFGDPHWLRVLAQRLNRVFTGNPEQSKRREALVAGLQTGFSSFRTKVSPAPKHPEGAKPDPGGLAILADVHANRPALEAVLDHLRSAGISRGVVLGDIVGYGPHPRDCIDLLRGSGFTLLKGNHDHGAANESPRKGFSNTAYWVIEWTRKVLDPETKAWLDDLPCYLEDDDWIALHGSPRDPTFFNGYVYQMTYEANLDELESRDVPICFHGHTHIQGTY